MTRGFDRREFLKFAGLGAAGVATLGSVGCARRSGKGPLVAGHSYVGSRQPDVAVVGAGAFGGWTALHLQQMGADVMLIDKYGPGNSRATSGGETRGVRSSYGDRPHGPQWARWAKRAIRYWNEWDERHADDMLPRVFFETGDLIFREEMEPYIERTTAAWDDLGAPYELVDPGEVGRRFTDVYDLSGIQVCLYEPDAGVVRARRAMESVAVVLRREGGEVAIAEARMGRRDGRRLSDLALSGADAVSAGSYVFALGPWFPFDFPRLMGKRIRVPVGHVYYFATPPGDERFLFPNCPSYSFDGVTGWPALSTDHRGFRVRTGGRAACHPDHSQRTFGEEFHGPIRQFVNDRIPELALAPILETRSCHYELSVSRNFIIDRHPDFDDVWIAGGGSAEAFKFGPVLGEYIAGRVLDRDQEPELAEGFRIPEDEYEDEEEPDADREPRPTACPTIELPPATSDEG